LKTSQILNFMKIRLVEAELFHVDQQTHIWTNRETNLTKLIDAFRNFANLPNKIPKSYTVCKTYNNIKVKVQTMKAFWEMNK